MKESKKSTAPPIRPTFTDVDTVERFFRSLKEECIWLHRFESLGQARVVINHWIRYYNEERPHQSLDYVAPRAHPALAA